MQEIRSGSTVRVVLPENDFLPLQVLKNTRKKKQFLFLSLKRNINQRRCNCRAWWRQAIVVRPAVNTNQSRMHARQNSFWSRWETRLCRARAGISSAHVVLERPTPAHHLVYRRFWTGTWRWRCTALTRTAYSARWATPVVTSVSNCWKLVWRGMLAGRVNARRSLSNIKYIFDRFCVFNDRFCVFVSFNCYCDVCLFVRLLPKMRKANVYVIGRLFKNLNLLPTVSFKIII